MEIRKYFERDTIAEHDVFLDDDEEIALLAGLKDLVQMQLGDNEETEYTAEQAIELAGLAFVAGRAFQSEIEGDFSSLEIEGNVPGAITVELSQQTIEALLTKVITESLRG